MKLHPKVFADLAEKIDAELISDINDFYNSIEGNEHFEIANWLMWSLVINLSLSDQKEIIPLLKKRDSAALLVEKLPQIVKFNDISISGSKAQLIWQDIGTYYRSLGRFHEALSIYSTLYAHILDAQTNLDKWVHKGMPLVWMYECYANMNYPSIAKRYLMLTLCEDAIYHEGNIPPETTGVYFRLVWGCGLSDKMFRYYQETIFSLYQKNLLESRYPEWLLQEIGDDDWMTEYPSPVESSCYTANSRYIKHLISKLGDGSGKNLELLAEYILSCMPGCHTTRRARTKSTDYDIVCSLEGTELDFRSELGRYFVCECKDKDKVANISDMAKFCRILDSTKARFGILFSKKGISGSGKTKNAEREQLKVFQDRGIVIVVIDLNDILKIKEGANFINLLRKKYVKVRLDISGGYP